MKEKPKHPTIKLLAVLDILLTVLFYSKPTLFVFIYTGTYLSFS